MRCQSYICIALALMVTACESSVEPEPSPPAKGSSSQAVVPKLIWSIGVSDAKDRKNYVRLNALLPFVINRNLLPVGVEIRSEAAARGGKPRHFLLHGEGAIQKTRVRVPTLLSVRSIYTQKHAATIQLVLGPMGSEEPTLLERISAHPEVDEAPRMIGKSGQTYWAMGYVKTVGPSLFEFTIAPNKPIKTMAALDLGQLNPGSAIRLIFQMPADEQIAGVRHGKHQLIYLANMNTTRQ
jgi:hypothetical protein